VSVTVTAEGVESYLTEALSQLCSDPELISRSATFEELDLDSLDLVEVSQLIEERYGIRLTGDALKRIETVGDAIDLVVSQAG
jgi:acyl carrier protein